MRLNISHRTVYRYEPAASKVSLRIKLFPSIYEGQSTEAWEVLVNGDPVQPLYMSAFGDDVALWQSREAQDTVEILASGLVLTADKSGIVRDLPRRPPSAIFLRSSDLTEPDEAICTLARKVAVKDELETMHALSLAVGDAVEYRAGTTESDTTAAAALAMGSGVCQDHAHILIAASRSLNIPARYVTGYFKASDSQADLLETHAWAEVHIRGLGWVGIDPSNGMSPTDHYVRISTGLDAEDAAPIKGHVVGGTEISLTAEVSVAENQQQ